MLRNYLKNFKNNFTEEAQIGVFNCLRIIKFARSDDMSGEDLSKLDLRRASLNGVRFTNGNTFATFDGSYISERTFLSQGHSGEITSIAFSDDGKRLLTASADKTIKEWDRATGECIITFEDGEDIVYGIMYWGDGDTILSLSGANASKQWKQWNRKTGERHIFPECSTLDESRDYADAKSPAPDLQFRVAIGDKHFDNEGTLFGIGEDFNTSSIGIGSISYCSETRHLFGYMQGLTICEICWDSGEIYNVFTHNPFEVIVGMTYENGRRQLLLYNKNPDFIPHIRELDWKTGQCLNMFEKLNGQFSTIHACNSNGTRILLTHTDNTIREWNRRTDAFSCIFEESVCLPVDAIYSPNEEYVLIAYADGSLKEWDIKTLKCLRTFMWHCGTSFRFAYSKDMHRILTITQNNIVFEWDRETGAYLNSYGHHASLKSRVEKQKDKRTLASESESGVLIEWDTETGVCIRVTNEDESKLIYESVDEPHAVSMDGNIVQLYHLCKNAFRSFVFYTTPKSNQGLTTTTWMNINGEHIEGRLYDDDGKSILCIPFDFPLTEWREKLLELGTDEVIFVSIDNTRRQLCVSNKEFEEDVIKILQHLDPRNTPESSPAKVIFSTFCKAINSLLNPVISDDEAKIVVYPNKYFIEVDKATGKEINVFKGHKDGIKSASFSEDGRYILSATMNEVKEWDRKTGNCIRAFDGKEGVFDAMYSYDPNCILSASSDGTFHKWNRETGDLIWSTPSYDGIYILGCSFCDCKFINSKIENIVAKFGGKFDGEVVSC